MNDATDTDADGIGNNVDIDDDGDGVNDSVDPFPLNPNETTDTDGDGIGNNTDADDDNDGIIDSVDDFPLDLAEYVDTDNDGIGDNTDDDDDADGVLDSDDPFPLNPAESIDTDGDGIGNNSDADDDGDGIVDSVDEYPLDLNEYIDTDNDGLGDNADDDDDADGVLDSQDAFRLDPTEHLDTDGDGLGNNVDSDDDNDAFTDDMDAFPSNVLEWFDTDLDGIGNNADDDDDGDGVLDAQDAFPLDIYESLDIDGDGLGNNSDSDDDNDGFVDHLDALPNDPLEHEDTDNDGIGNVADQDDDGDGVIDALDLFPLNANEFEDNDSDGLGNNEDSDDDNDGTPDHLDAFPLDPFEISDTDNDGIGDVLDNDDDGDGVLDFYDDLPLDANEQVDTDGDLIGDNADLDDDGDGMSDAFELLYNFDPLEEADGTYDTDQDGITNAEEAQANSNPLLDDYAPIIAPPQAVHINAAHTYTMLELADLISLTQVSVSDGKDGANCCNLTALGFETGAKNISSGLFPITWRAVDNAGNIATTEQTLNVHPLVNFAKEQTVAEGGTARVKVVLSGIAPSYPLEIPFNISGTVDDADYQLNSNKIVITEGSQGFIDIPFNIDFEIEGQEQFVISFEQGVNGGINNKHTIHVVETNVAPETSIVLQQNNIITNQIAIDAGEANITLTISDSNVDDTHIIAWQLPEYLGAQISANKLQVFIDPLAVALPDENKGLIELSVTVTDSGNTTNDGSEPLSQTKYFAVPLVNSLARLSTTDTDRDGISDLTEGYEDNDNDGLPAFLDISAIPYLQPLHVNSSVVKLAETEPGLHLQLGKFAKLQFSDGMQLSQQEIDATGLIEPDNLVNQGGYFDFEIHQITPFGNSAFIVLPLSQPIAEYAVYRKYTVENQWQDFVTNSNNGLASSVAVNGVCPAPQSQLYQEGLIIDNVCLRLFIEDGGPNDNDGIANGVIDDPGGIAIVSNETIAKETTPETSSSGSFSYIFLIILVVVSSRKYRFI